MSSPCKFFGWSAVLALAALLAGCASVQAPLAPSLEVAKPTTHLRALRKGDHVYLFWSVPTQTTDRQTVRHPGPTHICRGVEALLSTCGTPVGNGGPGANAPEKKSAVN